MKSLFLLSFLLLSGALSMSGQNFVDPTGTYLLKGEVKNGMIVGHSGELRVRLLDAGRVAMCLYVNKGYPGYESGSLMDTLSYADNRFVYTPETDSSCSIYFAFDPRTVEVYQLLSDPHAGCGFGPGVLIAAVFDKTSAEIPIIQDLSKRGPAGSNAAGNAVEHGAGSAVEKEFGKAPSLVGAGTRFFLPGCSKRNFRNIPKENQQQL